MRYLAVDMGDKRTGIAVGDAITRLATPLTVLEIPVDRNDGNALLDAIAKIVIEQLGPPASPGPRATGELVVGLPINMDGSEGQRAKLVRTFAATLGQRTQRTVHLFDERLTSADADWAMARTGMTHKQKKERRDAIAAAAILRGFLDALPR